MALPRLSLRRHYAISSSESKVAAHNITGPLSIDNSPPLGVRGVKRLPLLFLNAGLTGSFQGSLKRVRVPENQRREAN